MMEKKTQGAQTKGGGMFPAYFDKPGRKELPGDPISVTSMQVDVDRISYFSGNPRRAPNIKYDEIKGSIREMGLDNPLPISHRPDDPPGHYIIYAGGNTRLKALKELWEETRDPRFFSIRCEYHPYTSDTDALISHLRENDLRGDITFIDRALAVQDARARMGVEAGETLSLRKLEAAFKAKGFPASISMMSKLEYAAKLNAVIPSALKAGVGKLQIERLTKLETAALAVWRFHGSKYGTEKELREQVFAPALAGTDGLGDGWTYEAAEAAVKARLVALLPVAGEAAVLGSLKLALAGKELVGAPVAPIAAPVAPPPAQVAAAAFAPPVAGGGESGPAAGWAGGADEGGECGDGAYLEGDDGGQDGAWPAAPVPAPPEVPGGRWLDKLTKLRERNHRLAVALVDSYGIPNGRGTITAVDTGYGFIINDTFDLNWAVRLEERVMEPVDEDDRADAKATQGYASMVWWALLELSATLHDTAAPRQTCPPALLAQHVGPHSLLNVQPGSADGLPDMQDLMGVHNPVWPAARLRSFWCRLPPSQFAPAIELIQNVRTIHDLAEAAGLTAWEVETDGY